MKKIILTFTVLSTLLFVACTADDNIEDRPIFETLTGPQITAPEANTSYIFTFETKDLQAERFTFTDADFNFDAAATYSLQVDKVDNGFASAIELGSGNSLQIPVNIEVFNNAALTLGLAPFEASEVEFRIGATVGTGTPQYSETRVLTVTPYTTEAPKLYLIGSFLEASGYGANWTPAETLPLIEAMEFGNAEFEGFVFFNDAATEFKILPTNTSFDGDYGDASGTNGSYTEILVQEDEGNCGLPSGAGYYRVSVDLTDVDNLTYKLDKAEWAIVGAATPLGWPEGGTEGQPGNDHDMTYDPSTKQWSIEIDLSVGEFKFRANDDWKINLGGDPDEDGSMNYDGPNFSIDTAGTYKVTLDLSNARAYVNTLELQ